MPDIYLLGSVGSNPPDRIGEVVTQGLGYNLLPISQAQDVPSYSNILTGQNDLDQTPTGLGVPLQVTFGAGGTSANGDVTLDPTGRLTFNESGVYQLLINMYFQRSGNPGTCLVFFYSEINGVQFGNPIGVETNDSGTTQFQQFNFSGQIAAGTTIDFFIMRDSAYNDDGGLVSIASADGLGVAPSSVLRVFKY